MIKGENKKHNTFDYEQSIAQSNDELVQTGDKIGDKVVKVTTSQKIEKATESVVKNLLKGATQPDKKTDSLKKVAGNLANKK